MRGGEVGVFVGVCCEMVMEVRRVADQSECVRAGQQPEETSSATLVGSVE
jgi:hypothetical protein